MSQEMKAFSGMKTTRNFSFSHSEVIINSTPGRKVVPIMNNSEAGMKSCRRGKRSTFAATKLNRNYD